jgi:chromosome segregation ATPase
MFNKLLKQRAKKAESEKERLEKENESLREDRIRLKEEVEDLKLKKKVSEEDIKHMTKMKEEKLDIDHQKKVLELERGKQEAIATVKDAYQDKQEKTLNKQIEEGNKRYAEILARIPDINVKLKGDI